MKHRLLSLLLVSTACATAALATEHTAGPKASGLIPPPAMLPEVSTAAMTAAPPTAEATPRRQGPSDQDTGAPVPAEPPLLKLAAARFPDLDPTVAEVYAARGWQPLWTDAQGLTRRGEALRAALAEAERHGLDPDRYRLPDATAAGMTPQDLDLALSKMAIKLARDLQGGTLATQHQIHVAYPAARSPATTLETLAAAADPGEALTASAPDSPLYRDLLQALEQYRLAAAAGGWDPVPEGPTVRPGEADVDQVPALRRRLLISGDLPMDQARDLDAPAYDPTLEQAVRRFQDRHGLEEDGILGPNTRAALNVPADQRIRTVMLNLDRLRWMPDDLGQRHILVNIAGFEVMVFEDGHPIFRSPIIVGKRHQQTPAFSDTAEHVVFNPYWNVPRSIAREEIAPAAARDPNYIFGQDMEILAPGGGTVSPYAVDWQAAARNGVPYRIRQRPGGGNALGRIKILFPNDFAVYLHDTPSKYLFDRRVRAFSHGCMRVGKPFALAAQVLGWPVEDVMDRVNSGRHQWVNVDNPMPVHVTYLTAWVDPESGAVQFRDDIYGRDDDMTGQVAQLPTMPGDRTDQMARMPDPLRTPASTPATETAPPVE